MKIKFYIIRGLAIFFGGVTLILGIAHYELIKYDSQTGEISDIWGFPTTKFDYDNPLFTTIFNAVPRLVNMLTVHNIIGLTGFIIGIGISYGLWQLSESYRN